MRSKGSTTAETAASGRAEVLAEQEKPFMQQTLEEVPLVGGWLSEQFYGSAKNTAPDAEDGREQELRRSGAFYDENAAP